MLNWSWIVWNLSISSHLYCRYSLSCKCTSAAVLSAVKAQTFSSSTDWTSSSFRRSSLIRWVSKCLGTPGGRENGHQSSRCNIFIKANQSKLGENEPGLTFQYNDYCVSNDADCGEQDQNWENVGADGVRQLQLRLWSQDICVE